MPRTLAEVESFFDGFELVPPGVVNINSWPVPVPEYATKTARCCTGESDGDDETARQVRASQVACVPVPVSPAA